MRGLIEIFTGNGRGKYSSALGMAIRALGHDSRVHIVYFMKGDFPNGEQKVLTQIPNVTFATFCQYGFVDPANIQPEEREQAMQALEETRRAISSNQFDLVVLDEVNVALAWKLVDLNEIIEIIKDKPDKVELILTGRYADGRIARLADLVTEMVEVNHSYQQGIVSREGFDY